MAVEKIIVGTALRVQFQTGVEAEVTAAMDQIIAKNIFVIKSPRKRTITSSLVVL